MPLQIDAWRAVQASAAYVTPGVDLTEVDHDAGAVAGFTGEVANGLS